MRHQNSLQRQRGIGTIAVALILLFGMSVAVFFANRNVLFEQRTAVNQTRSTEALELAEAGVEWAMGMLNNSLEVGTACTASSSSTTFRNRFLNPTGNAFAPTGLVAGCKRLSGAWSCSCPTTGAVALSASSGPSFTVSFAAVAGFPDMVSVTAVGCTAHGGTGACAAGGSNAPDARATVSAQLKVSPLMPAKAPSPIVCGGNCAIGGSYNVVNTSVATNGILVNAGGTITSGAGTSYTTIPGQPADNALIGSDASLGNLASSDATCSNSSMFRTFFGTTIQEYKNQPGVKTISCSSANDCKTQVENAYNAGSRAFYFSSDFQLSGNGTLGSATDPVTFVTENAIKINGTWDVYGVLFSNSADVNDLGTGAANIYGAIISCKDYNNNGNGTATYNEDVMNNLNLKNGAMVRVPGSWRDW